MNTKSKSAKSKEARIGIHLTGFKKFSDAVDRAEAMGLPVFQFFTGNARSWSSKPIDPDEAEAFCRRIEETGILPVAHMPYIPNLASPEKDVHEKSVKTLIDEVRRCALLKVPYLVTHLGSHKGEGEEGGRERIVKAVSAALEASGTETVTILLENTAGTKNSLGTTFEGIALLLDALNSDRVGICFDTAHALAAGYDIRNDEGVELMVKQMKKNFSITKLKVIHLNDSKVEFGGKADRHQHLGEGHLGKRGVTAVLHNKTLRERPFILETPEDEKIDDAENIRRAREWAE